MFKLLVRDCYAWSAWQFFQVKDRKGNYRDIPGAWRMDAVCRIFPIVAFVVQHYSLYPNEV